MKAISPEILKQRLATDNSVILIDVRTAAEYAAGHIAQAIHEPLEHLDPSAFVIRQTNLKMELYVICQAGTRARNAIKRLEAAGLSNCVLVDGGMSAWVKAGFEVKKQAKQAISLERQVRIAAGLVILCGTLLGAFVHSALLALPALVGAGLMFAGFSDICGMGLFLARMPWNQINGDVKTNVCCEVNS